MTAAPTLAMLARHLTPRERMGIERRARRALERGTSCALPATAFVSIYERGRVIGCVGHADFQRARAAAEHDLRFGGPRGGLEARTVQLSLLVRGRVTTPPVAATQLEVGRHGLVALDAAGAIQAVLLPEVAVDGQRDAPAMLAVLAAKAGLPGPAALARVMLVESERFPLRPVARCARRRATASPRAARDAAAVWLAARVGPDGEVPYGVDARSGRVHRSGAFHLGRAAVAIEALAAHGGHGRAVARARAWLAATLRAALETDGEGLPRTPAERAGSLALAQRAGVDVRRVLGSFAAVEAERIAENGWHAAQIASVLGPTTPAAVARAALAPIDTGAFSPWSVLAADALGDDRRATLGRRELARTIRARAPHRGGVGTGSVPEVALTALVLEVLGPHATHRPAVARAREILLAQQLLDPRRLHAALDPTLALGAFPLAPHADFLRVDVTAHALLALLAR